MNITFNNQYSCSLKKNLKHFDSIKIAKAVFPLTYYNVKGSLSNNYIRYVILDETKTKAEKRGSLIFDDGLYTLEEYNDRLQT